MKYTTMKERLKNRSDCISECHLSEEDVDNMLRHVLHNGGSPTPHSSTSNYAPTQQKV